MHESRCGPRAGGPRRSRVTTLGDVAITSVGALRVRSTVAVRGTLRPARPAGSRRGGRRLAGAGPADRGGVRDQDPETGADLRPGGRRGTARPAGLGGAAGPSE